MKTWTAMALVVPGLLTAGCQDGSRPAQSQAPAPTASRTSTAGQPQAGADEWRSPPDFSGLLGTGGSGAASPGAGTREAQAPLVMDANTSHETETELMTHETPRSVR